MSIKISSEQKALEGRRNALQAERKVLIQEIEDKQRLATEQKKKIQNLQEQIEALKAKVPSEIIISEHAMLRYIERILGIDLDEIQQKILPEKDREMISKLGDCKFGVNGHTVVVKNNVVVTVND